MLGIDPSFICHQLHLDLTAKPVIQEKPNHVPKQSKIIESETEELKDSNFIVEVHTPSG